MTTVHAGTRVRESVLLVCVKALCVVTLLLVLAENAVVLVLFTRSGLLVTVFLSLIVPYFGFEGARGSFTLMRMLDITHLSVIYHIKMFVPAFSHEILKNSTRSARLLTSYYIFNIASVAVFIANISYLGASLKAMYADPLQTPADLAFATSYVNYVAAFGAGVAALQILGAIISRDLIQNHLLPEANMNRFSGTGFVTMLPPGAFANRRLDSPLSGLPINEINALPTITLAADWKDTGDDSISMCVICQDDPAPGDVIKTLPCKHKFHAKCIDEWLHRSASCPMCNQHITVNPASSSLATAPLEPTNLAPIQVSPSPSNGAAQRDISAMV